MNYKFRKKPVVVEAFQMTEARGSDNAEWPEWLHRAWSAEAGEPGSLYLLASKERRMCIGTLEGPHEVTWNDYIIQGVKGEIYPCKPDIFEATYEEVKA